MDSVMSKRENRQAVPAEMLSKEFLSQFKTEVEVAQFLKDLHYQVILSDKPWKTVHRT